MKKKTHVEILEKLVIRYGIKDVFFQRILDALEEGENTQAIDFLKDLIYKYGIEEDQLCEVLAEVYHTPMVELNRNELDREVVDRLGFDTCYRYNLIPFRVEAKNIHLACFHPGNLESADIVESVTGLKPKMYACPYDELRAAIGSMYPMETDLAHYFDALGVSRVELDKYLRTMEEKEREEIEGVPEEESEYSDEPPESPDNSDEAGEAGEVPPPLPTQKKTETHSTEAVENYPEILKLVRKIIIKAVSSRAEEVEFAFTGTAVALRFQIDGAWFDELVLARSFHPMMAYAVESVCGVKILEPGENRSVRIDIGEAEHPMRARLQFDRSEDGWSYRIFIPDVKTRSKDLLKLGISQSTLKRFRKAFEDPKGLVLVTGLPGSGRTTTLYAALKELSEKDRKIVTYEHPVKWKVEGATQHEIRKSSALIEALAESFKNPPDVLMLSDIDDPEVLELAFQAAEQGMLVLARMKAESAAEALVRLVEQMEMPADRVADVVTGVLNQRLLRRSCPYCTEEVEPTGKDKKILALLGRKSVKKVSVENGCEFCRWVGLAGRTGVFEFLPVTGPVAETLKIQPDVIPLRREMKKRGLKRLVDYAYLKAYDGITTLAEAHRVATLAPLGGISKDDDAVPPVLEKEVQTVYESGAVTALAPIYRVHLERSQHTPQRNEPTAIRELSDFSPILTVIYSGDAKHRDQARKVLEGEADETTQGISFKHALNLSNGEVVLHQLGQLRALLAPKPAAIPAPVEDKKEEATEEKQEATARDDKRDVIPDEPPKRRWGRGKSGEPLQKGPHSRALHLDPQKPVMTAQSVMGAVGQSALNFFTNGQNYAKGLIELVIYENATPLSLMFILTLAGLLVEGFVASRAIDVSLGLGFSPLTLLIPVFHHLSLGIPSWLEYALASLVGLLLISMIFWLTLKLLGDELPIMLLLTLLGFPRAIMALVLGVLVVILQSRNVPHLGYVVFLVGLVGIWRMVAVLRSFAYQFSEAVIHIIVVMGVSFALFGAIVVTDPRIDFYNSTEYQTITAFIQQVYDPEGYQEQQQKKTIDKKRLQQAALLLADEKSQQEAIETLKKMTEQVKNLKATEVQETYKKIQEQISTAAAELNTCKDVQTNSELINDMAVQVLMRPAKAEQMTSLVQNMIQAGETNDQEAFVEADEKLVEFLEDFSQNEAKQEGIELNAAIMGPEVGNEGDTLRFSLAIESTTPKVERPVVYWDLSYDGTSFQPDLEREPGMEITSNWPDDGEYRIAARVGDGTNGLSRIIEKNVRVNNVPPTLVPVRRKYVFKENQPLKILNRILDPANDHDTYVIEYDMKYSGKRFEADEIVENHNAYDLNDSEVPSGVFPIAMRPRDEDCGFGDIVVVQVARGQKAAKELFGKQGPFYEGEDVRVEADYSLTEFEQEPYMVRWDLNYSKKKFNTDRMVSNETSLIVRFPDEGKYTLAYKPKKAGMDERKESPIVVQVLNRPPKATLSPDFVKVPPRKKVVLLADCKDPGEDDTIAQYQWDTNYDGHRFNVTKKGKNISSLEIKAPLSGTLHVAMRCVDNDKGIGEAAVTSVVVSE